MTYAKSARNSCSKLSGHHSRAALKECISFSDPAHSYEDFKAEVIHLYPEALTAQQYNIYSLQQLISDHTCIQIHLEGKLSKYYQEFCLISHNLTTMHRIGMQEHARHFLASFKPCLASRIDSQLKAKLPDHCPLNPYRVEDILYMTLHCIPSSAELARLSYRHRTMFYYLVCLFKTHPHHSKYCHTQSHHFCQH